MFCENVVSNLVSCYVSFMKQQINLLSSSLKTFIHEAVWFLLQLEACNTL